MPERNSRVWHCFVFCSIKQGMCVLHLPVEKMSSRTHHVDPRSMRNGFNYWEVNHEIRFNSTVAELCLVFALGLL